MFIQNSDYRIPRITPDELTKIEHEKARRQLKLEPSNIQGHAFPYTYHSIHGFRLYHFLANFKVNDIFEDYEIVFGLTSESSTISVFKIRIMPYKPKHEYYAKVGDYNNMIMGSSEDEYYTIKSFHRGIKTIKVSPRIEYKIRTRHELDIYDVIEPLHVGRLRKQFSVSMKNGYLSRESGHVIAQTSTGEIIKIILEVTQDTEGLIFNLKSAYRSKKTDPV